MTEPPGFHVANVHAVEAGYRQDRLHDALGILLSGFTVGQKASQPVNRCHNATFVFSSVGKRIARSISTTVGRAREILIPNLQSGWRILPRSYHPLLGPLPEGEGTARQSLPSSVKRQRRIKNTHRFVKFFLVIDKNFFLLCRRRAICGSVMSTKQNRDSGKNYAQ